LFELLPVIIGFRVTATGPRGGSRRTSRGTEADLAERKAAELATLKLVRNRLEEHVGRFGLFDLDQNRGPLVGREHEDDRRT
jgi:hypothetical protein